jgi:hypothetical protein
MGSDFCFAFIAINIGKEPDWSAAEKEIERLKDVHISKWPEYWVEVSFDYDAAKVKAGEPDLNFRLPAVEALRKTLASIRDLWDSGTREVGYFEYVGKQFMLTGGMSHGDAPTDAYSIINQFLESGLAKAAGFD